MPTHEQADHLNILATIGARISLLATGSFAALSAASGQVPATVIFCLTAAAQGGLCWLSGRQLGHQLQHPQTERNNPQAARQRCKNAFMRVALPPLLLVGGYHLAELVDPAPATTTTLRQAATPR